MKKLIISALIAATSFCAQAAPDETYVCDGQVVNLKTNDQGTIVMDMATIERVGDHYKVTVKNADNGTSADQFFTRKTRTPRVINGVTYFFIMDEVPGNRFNFVEIDNNMALGYITDTTGTANQLQLQCTLK